MRAEPHHLEQLGSGREQGNAELIPPGKKSLRSIKYHLLPQWVQGGQGTTLSTSRDTTHTGNDGGQPGPKTGQRSDANLDGLDLFRIATPEHLVYQLIIVSLIIKRMELLKFIPVIMKYLFKDIPSGSEFSFHG
jgi:hypothetical protein